MIIDLLCCGFLVAVCCDIQSDRIVVGLLIAEDEPEPQEVDLYAEDDQCYRVLFEKSGINVELRRL